MVVPYLPITEQRGSEAGKDTSCSGHVYCFKGQTTPGILTLLETHNTSQLIALTNYNRLIVSINKPLKVEMKRRFQTWYAVEVEKHLNDDIAIEQVKVEKPVSIIKNESAKWMMSAWQALQKCPDMAINGFRKAGMVSTQSPTSPLL